MHKICLLSSGRGNEFIVALLVPRAVVVDVLAAVRDGRSTGSCASRVVSRRRRCCSSVVYSLVATDASSPPQYGRTGSSRGLVIGNSAKILTSFYCRYSCATQTENMKPASVGSRVSYAAGK